MGMTRTIVCYGDSNTHGADPAGGPRLGRDVRWPGVLRASLGEGYEVIEEGLSGRNTVWESPLAPYRDGSAYLMPCLLSHEPVDLVIIMLGTNDLKRQYGLTAPEIAVGVGRLIGMAKGSLCGPGATPPAVLAVAPVPLGETTLASELWGFGAAREESTRLARLIDEAARQQGVASFDAGSVAQVSPLDGVHLDAEAHARLGRALADATRAILVGAEATSWGVSRDE
jgi:lysophospholipase L1-like esterase